MTTSQVSQLREISPLLIEKRTGAINAAEIISILKGQITGLHIRRGFNLEVANEIVGNFVANAGLKERQDGVPGQYVGASHYRKDAATYFAQSENARTFVDALFGSLVDPVHAVFDALRRQLLKQGIELRLARSNEGHANICRAVSWSGAGMYALGPHDDLAQVQHAGADCEIVAVANYTVVALNFYPSAADEGGCLRIWGHKPTANDRRSQGLEATGYPYHPTYLETIPYQDLQLETGDIALIDGGYVHAVTPCRGKRRLILNSFLGFARPDLVLWWT